MSRFFVHEDQVRDGRFVITGSDAKHIGRVLRLRVKDEITLVTHDGRGYLGTIESVEREQVSGSIQPDAGGNTEASVEITLIQGLPKGNKMELIIQKATEIGVVRIQPVLTQRAVARWDGEGTGHKIVRWQKIAQEAAKQSHRHRIPVVEEPLPWEEFLTRDKGRWDLRILPWEGTKDGSLKALLTSTGHYHHVQILIGPEGGLSPEEVAFAMEHGARPISLGPRILRTETAGLVTAAVVLYEAGDLEGRS
jgi:16S rRNA (uracil1498-N3)-methyltransferase